MGNFDRGGGFRSRPSFRDKPSFSSSRPRFNDRGPVTLHKAICDNCGKECEVPFRPTSGKPIFCSSCFENQRGGSDSRRPEDRPMFEATCADCGNACTVPFRPSTDKPVFCSNCFGDKKNSGNKNTGQPEPREQYNAQFAELNSKLDTILKMLTPPKKVASAKKK